MRKINTRDFVRATRFTAREINRQIVLNLVRENQPISRADLARRMEVGRGMVTSLINELLDEGAIYEGDTVDAPRGRRPKMLHIRTRNRLVVAIDVRFSQTFVMLGDLSGRQIALETFETIVEPEALVDELARRIRRLLRAHGAIGDCEGIGLVVPGMVDRKKGKVLNSPQLGWKEVAIRDLLGEATGMPVVVENAPIACAFAQMWLGSSAISTGDFVYVTVSDGVGAAIVVNGEVVRGSGNVAGEFGHVRISLDGPRCLCGGDGCWEAYTSNLATIARYLREDKSPGEMRGLLHRTGLTMTDLVHRARSGEERARTALTETAYYLGVGLSMIINSLNPAQILVGGEITAAWELIEPEVRRVVTDRALTRASASTPIVPEQVGGYPRLRGAVALLAAPLFAAPKVA
jgi:N-acetylglucosamine repressor